MNSYRFAGPLIRFLDPEAAHGLTIWALRHGLVRRRAEADDPRLAQRLWGLDFANPVGLAAGFDKNAAVVDAMLGLGFGFVEAGSVTPRPQKGNPRPRLFRLSRDRAVINRLGFNGEGHDAVAARLAERETGGQGGGKGVLGINLGANRDSADPAADYEAGVRRFARQADYLVVNVSSPNTPGLRDLQARGRLEALLDRVLAAREAACVGQDRPTPLLLKIAPDLAPEDTAGIAEAALARTLDGLIIGNTSVELRDGLKSRHAGEPGGLSGRPLFERSTTLLREVYRLTKGQMTLVGVGGVASGADAYAKIRAGASLVELYTALVFEGPGLAGRIKAELAALLAVDGFEHVSDAVGVDASN